MYNILRGIDKFLIQVLKCLLYVCTRTAREYFNPVLNVKHDKTRYVREGVRAIKLKNKTLFE